MQTGPIRKWFQGWSGLTQRRFVTTILALTMRQAPTNVIGFWWHQRLIRVIECVASQGQCAQCSHSVACNTPNLPHFGDYSTGATMATSPPTHSEMPTHAEQKLYFPCENLYFVMSISIIFYQNLYPPWFIMDGYFLWGRQNLHLVQFCGKKNTPISMNTNKLVPVDVSAHCIPFSYKTSMRACLVKKGW